MKKVIISVIEFIYIGLVFLILSLLFITEIIGKLYRLADNKIKNRVVKKSSSPSTDLTPLQA